MLSFMGVTGKAITPDALSTLDSNDVVLIGADHTPLPETAATLVWLGGNTDVPVRERRVFARYTTLCGIEIPLFVPVVADAKQGDVILATAKDENGVEIPALVRRGKDYRYFFDLPATIWFSGDGYTEMQNEAYFPLGRTPDWRPLPDGVVCSEPFNDLLLIELEGILRSLGVPSLYRLPPMEDGSVPDLVLHFSGDDDCTSADFNRKASRMMHEMGFPYHINAMPNGNGDFVFDLEVLRELNENGCELGLHLDLTATPYKQESVLAQNEYFERAFGISPCTNVNHCLIQDGTQSELLRWLQGCGIIADNGYLGTFDPQDINAFDLCGFGYGTSFPRYTCDDAAHDNQLLTTMAIPVTYYEARLPAEDSDTSKVRAYLDGAAKNARIAQFFFHPHYLNDISDQFPATTRVLRLINSHVAAQGYCALSMTTNTIATFWQKRAAATIDVSSEGITVSTETPILLRLPCDVDTAMLDGKTVATTHKCVESAVATLLRIPAGKHEVKL
jgi:hypothetical protein